MNSRESEIIELIKKEVKPALGCTEPIAVALAVAKAVEILQEKCSCPHNDWRMKADFTIKVEVSGNILKNGMGVGIPGTGMVGLHIASALGAVCGKTEYGLEVLHDLNGESIDRAKKLVEDGKVTVGLADTTHKLYVKACVSTSEGHKASALIEDDHDNIVETWFDDTVLNSTGTASESGEDGGKTTLDYHLTVREILDFASTVPFEDIRFILESRDMNLALANEGLESSYGLRVGHTILSEKLMTRFSIGEIDKVILIYQHFASTSRQEMRAETFLPINLQEIGTDSKAAERKGKQLDFIIEPSVQSIVESLIPTSLHFKIFTALLDSLAAEHSARVMAMQVATDNADELIEQLTLAYNKARQQAITSELLDIMGGSMQ